VNKKIIVIGTAVALAGWLITESANASPVLCQQLGHDHMYIDSAYVSGCVDAGMGNINGNSGTDDFLTSEGNALGYVGINGGSFSQSGFTGTFNLNPALWDTNSGIAIGFKFGTGGQPDEWFIYTLDSHVSSGTWWFVNIFEKGGGLSHVQLYSTGSTTPPTRVPEPSTLGILGLGLLGVGLVRRRQKG